MSRSVRATIHVAALRENLERIRAAAPRSRVMAVVKADGYGHGLERVAAALAGADAFGVASIADGERLRRAGFAHRIVVLSGIDCGADIAAMQALELDSVVHHEAQIGLFEQHRGGPALGLWLEIDTGMHRLGLPPTAVPAALARLTRLAHVAPDPVLMSHFANSDVSTDPVTLRQIERFEAIAAGRRLARSLANSAGVLGFPQACDEWVRVGGLLYGISVIAGRSGTDLGFLPAMTLSTRLIAINAVERGERIGYAGTYTCPEAMRVGVATIGYGDGYPRHARGGAPVLIGGREAAIVGRVSMDLITIDLRAHPDAAIGDEVVLWGRGLPVERVAEAAATIGYELVCGMTRRVEFVEDHAALR
jgi:alanine racemase